MKKNLIILSTFFLLPAIGFSQSPIPKTEIALKEIGKIKPRKATEVKASLLGIGCEVLDRDYARYDAYKEYLGELAAKHARFQSGWAKTEKQKGVYDFRWFDIIIDDCLSRGVQPWVCICYGNPIYEGGGGIDLGGGLPTSEVALAAWEKYVEELVKRNKNKVKEWEIWNEADLRNQAPAEVYAELYIRTGEIIRKIQPKAILTALAAAHYGSERGDEFITTFFDYLKERNKLHLVDIVTYHGYPSNPDGGIEAQNRLFELVRRYNKKIRFKQGETGSPSTQGSSGALSNVPFTELTQTKWDMRRTLFHIGRGIEFNLFSLSEFSYPKTGLNTKGKLKLNEDLSVAYPKACYFAYQNLTSLFDYTLSPMQTTPYSIQSNIKSSIYSFKDKESKSVVLTYWESENVPGESLSVNKASIDVTGIKYKEPVLIDVRTGIVYEIPSSSFTNSNGKITVQVPVYDCPLVLCDKSVLTKKKLL